MGRLAITAGGSDRAGGGVGHDAGPVGEESARLQGSGERERGC